MSSLAHALEARVQWALHRVALVAGNEDAAEAYMTDAQIEAFQSGCEAYREDSRLPMLLFDVPMLAVEWRSGWKYQAEGEEIACCVFCNDDTGNPCPSHG
ncbi:hypothetical protein KEX41_29740 (plasmid) [Burkholderia thailandensis]|jgi:hypothetical protein|uniref:hypothetical protein n=1 Tax=Burkholderia thailandensis TaxID=57975 RepID=UPI00192DEE74|nr:hypothetical protein [Burkholderia thailandensis]MBS2132367.1 hypothetical protein [Burkholderia thailandensis]QRA15172.1 hypothetical protein JMY07_30165 [Burkholderia thailandensis]